MLKRLFLLLFVLSQNCRAGFFDFFVPKEPTPAEKIAELRKQQIDYPEDPVINYNLGVALYKQDLFDQARVAFRRSVEHSEGRKYGIIQQQALFNSGNSAYQNSLRLLPVGWQTKEDIENETLSAAINHVTEAIDGYKKALEKNPLLYQAQMNIKKAEELKKQLEEKLKYQQQHPNKQQQNKQNSSDQKAGDKANHKDDGQHKEAGKNGPDQSDKPEEKGQHNPDGNEKNKDAQEQDLNHDNQSKNNQDTKPSPQERTQPDQEKQASEEEQAGQACQAQETPGTEEQKETAMTRALFDSLKNDETQSQKRFLQRQMRRENPIKHPGQKPW